MKAGSKIREGKRKRRKNKWRKRREIRKNENRKQTYKKKPNGMVENAKNLNERTRKW